MMTTIELPLWALILMGVLAAFTAASHLLFPSVRWFFRKRAERVVARLNRNLTRPIQPFKLARRHDMIQNILYDPDVIRAVNDHAEAEGIPDNVAFEQAQRYAGEIVPAFSATLYFAFGIRVARWMATSLYRVRVFSRDADALARIDPDATVIFIMNHRSNMDYVLVTYLVAPDTPLSYAVGEWARVWPLRPIIKMMGGYFIRRRERNALYRKVLSRYVQLSTREQVAQAVFPEGGLSRDGAIGVPKLGLLSYVLEGFDPRKSNDVVFVPVGLNYDRVLEDRALLASSTRAGTRFKFRMSVVFRYLRRHILQRLTGRFHRLGFAAVSFGSPISLKAFYDGDETDLLERLGSALMDEVAEVVPTMPVPLVAQVLEVTDGTITRDALQNGFDTLVEILGSRGAMCLPDAGAEEAVTEAVRMFEARGLVKVQGDMISITDKHPEVIGYYAASIRHFLR
ncbi:MAG: 1-acyl-sn-glycerol-3-phosphate acyltransferase [Pseudomonadota bacterium]